MTVYELRDYCDDLTFYVDGEEIDFEELSELVDPTGETAIDEDDMDEFEVAFLSGNQWGGLAIDLDETMDGIVDTLQCNYEVGAYAIEEDEDEDDDEE